MPAAVRRVRGQGTLVAVGFPAAALLAVGLWLRLHGAGITTSVPAAATLVVMAALAEQIELVVSPRMHVSPAGAFVAAAALIGGPLIGALAGASVDALSTGDVWRKRCAWAGADALQGFVIGLVGVQLALRSPDGALALAAVGLLTGLLLNWLNVVIVALDRRVELRPQLAASWRTHLVTWLLPWPPLAAFLFSYRLAPSVALALVSGLLVAVWLGNRLRLRLEQSLAEERARARLDALTGAPNRYALDEALTAEHARITRGGRPAALCFLDLDHFREVNNTYGYLAGDRLLVTVYQRLREELRAGDQIFRWGGEEFVVLAPDQPDVADVAERLRRTVAERPFVVEGHQLVVTGSVGAVRLDESRTPEDALEAASRLVQVAKQRRDAIEVEPAAVRHTAQPSPARLRGRARAVRAARRT